MNDDRRKRMSDDGVSVCACCNMYVELGALRATVNGKPWCQTCFKIMSVLSYVSKKGNPL